MDSNKLFLVIFGCVYYSLYVLLICSLLALHFAKAFQTSAMWCEKYTIFVYTAQSIVQWFETVVTLSNHIHIQQTLCIDSAEKWKSLFLLDKPPIMPALSITSTNVPDYTYRKIKRQRKKNCRKNNMEAQEKQT